MDFIKKHAKTILSAIALIFIGGLFYMNYASKGPTAVEVNGKKIPYDEFRRTYSKDLDNARDKSKGDLTHEDIKKIEQRTLATMVQDELILQEADKLGIQVPDQVVASTIMSMKAFRKDGVFSAQLYQRVLKMYYRMPRYEFEETLRNSVKRQFLRSLVLAASKTSPMELAHDFRMKFPDEKYADKKDKFKTETLNEKRSLIYYSWMNRLINKAKITNNLPKLEAGGS